MSPRRPLLGPLALASAAALAAWAPGEARADDAALPVTVVTIQTDDMVDQAEALTSALKASLRRKPGYTLQEGEWALEVLTVSLECADPPDAACETKMGDQTKSDRLLWGTLKKRDGATVAGELHLWTRGKGSKATSVAYAANLTEAADESLVAIADRAVEDLTGGSPEGQVKLRVGTIDGQVFEGTKLLGEIVGGQATLRLPPGRHTLVVKGAATTDLQAIVEVKPLTTVEVTLSPQRPEPGPDWQKIAGFSAIGLGVGFGAVGVVSSLRVQGLNEDLDPARQFVGANEDVCDAAASDTKDPQFDTARVADICNEASTFETLQMVMYPLAALSVGAGIVLLSTADWSGDDERAELVVEPRVGLGGGDVRLTYSF